MHQQLNVLLERYIGVLYVGALYVGVLYVCALYLYQTLRDHNETSDICFNWGVTNFYADRQSSLIPQEDQFNDPALHFRCHLQFDNWFPKIILVTKDWTDEEVRPFIEASFESCVEIRFDCNVDYIFGPLLSLLGHDDHRIVERSIEILFGIQTYDLLPYFNDHRHRKFPIELLMHLLFANGSNSFINILANRDTKRRYIKFAQDLMNWYFESDAYKYRYVKYLGEKNYLRRYMNESKEMSKKFAKFMRKYIVYIKEEEDESEQNKNINRFLYFFLCILIIN